MTDQIISIVKTKPVNTKGEWVKVEDIFEFTLIDDNLYNIQVCGEAKLSYGTSTPNEGCFVINFPQPFTYEKESGQDLYISTVDNGAFVTVVTIAGKVTIAE